LCDAAYPVHTGEAAGLPGRMSALVSELLLLGTMPLGATMW
jgi:uncharacterized iron-regulated membrane protein